MKIAMVIEGRDPIYGGGQVHVDYLSRILVGNRKYQVDIFTRKIEDINGTKYEADETNTYGVNVIRVGPVGVFFNGYLRIICLITMTFELRRRARKEKYDIIHAHSMLPGIPAKIVGWLLSIPVVYTVHGTMFMDANKKGLSYYFEKFMVCVLRYNLEISVSSSIFRYKNNNTNVKVVHNGVDLSAIQKTIIKDKYNKLTFLTVGRMDRQKNYQIILDAIMKIGRDFFVKNAIQFVWVGDGLQREQLSAFVQEHNLDDVVVFKGKLAYEDAIKEFKKSHLFLSPSLAEGQPLTVLEALGCSLPVLATNVGDNASIITDGYNGELFEAGNIDSLVQIIEKYATMEPKVIERIGNNGYKFVQSYTREACVDRVVECYSSLVAKT